MCRTQRNLCTGIFARFKPPANKNRTTPRSKIRAETKSPPRENLWAIVVDQWSALLINGGEHKLGDRLFSQPRRFMQVADEFAAQIKFWVSPANH